MTEPVKITGMDGVAVHETESATMISGTGEQAVESFPTTSIPASDRLFPGLYFRIRTTENPGELRVENVNTFFNAIQGANDPLDTIPGVSSPMLVTVPEDGDGAIYLIAPLVTGAWSVEYHATRPSKPVTTYVRVLANVSRSGDGAATFSHRHIGLITIPSQMLISSLL